MGKVIGTLGDDGVITAPKEVDPQGLRLGVQGLSLGFGEEAEAAARAGFGLLTGQADDFQSAYDVEVKALRDKLKAAREAYPYSSMGYEAAGAILPGIVATIATGGAAGPSAAGNIGRILLGPTGGSLAKGAVYGGAGAGAYEIGTGEGGISERLEGVPEAVAVGTVAAPVFQLGARAAGSALGNVVDFAKRKFGPKASTVVENEVRRIAENSGQDFDDLMAKVLDGETLLEASETSRKVLGAYAGSLDDKAREAIRERAKRARKAAEGETQKILQGDTDVNVLKLFRSGEEAAKTKASSAYDVVFDAFPEVPASINPIIQKILNREESILNSSLKLIKTAGVDEPFFDVVNGRVKLNKAPTLREAENIRRALDDLIDDSKGNLRNEYKALERELRSALDDAAPELSNVRQTWSNIMTGSEAFEAGRTVFGKSSDEVEIIFENYAAKGPDALAAFRQGLMDAILKKAEGGAKSSLPRLLTDMDAKEAKIFATIFPADEYDKAYKLWDKAKRSQMAAGELGGAQTAERTARQASAGMNGVISDVAEALQLSLPAVGRLMSRGLSVLGQRVSDQQKAEVIKILMSEDPKLVERVLKDNTGWDIVQKRVIDIFRGLEGPAAKAGALVGSKAPEPFTGKQE
jgi:hypothetical protein